MLTGNRTYVYDLKKIKLNKYQYRLCNFLLILILDVGLMVKFAMLEINYGDKERAQTLFEQILSSYAKRVDIWSTYVDTLVKSDDLDGARYDIKIYICCIYMHSIK